MYLCSKSSRYFLELAFNSFLKKDIAVPETLTSLYSKFSRQDLKETFIDSGVMSAIKEWLSPLPDRSLPALKIREELLKILQEVRSWCFAVWLSLICILQAEFSFSDEFSVLVMSFYEPLTQHVHFWKWHVQVVVRCSLDAVIN